MPKRKRNSAVQKKKDQSALGSDDENLFDDLSNPDPNSRSYIYDEVDEFHEVQDKILLDGKRKIQNLEDDDSSVEEVLPLLSGDESSDDDDDIYTQMARKDEIASDLEEDVEDGLPDPKAWGKKKSVYYNTDYVDQDYGGFQGSDEELAENEEKEALAIQKRMLEQLEDEDFGFQWLKQPQKADDVEKVKDHSKITVDFSRMSQQEKLQMLKMESPELLDLIHDFSFYMTELNERLKPLLVLVKEGKLSSKSGTSYILSKHQLIMMYCTNISFYMVLKCRGTSVRSHPIMKRLAMFKKLLKEFEKADQKLADEINNILERTKSNADVAFKPNKNLPLKKQKHRFRILEMQPEALPTENKAEEKIKKKEVQPLETDAEKEAFHLYKMMKVGHKKLVDNEETDDDSERDDKESENVLEEGDEDETIGKREINYQIAKNKGLTPHRKKEYRNPRVRQRMKYRRANIRRKGQVRTPKTETSRYGGEMSGIRSGVVRSVKLR